MTTAVLDPPTAPTAETKTETETLMMKALGYHGPGKRACVTACLKCDFCKRGMYSRCRHGGWILGNLVVGPVVST